MKKGFTLIELMIVVAIIGILTAIAVPRFGQMYQFSKAKTIYTLDDGTRVPSQNVLEVRENYLKYKVMFDEGTIMEYTGPLKIENRGSAVGTPASGNIKVLGGK